MSSRHFPLEPRSLPRLERWQAFSAPEFSLRMLHQSSHAQTQLVTSAKTMMSLASCDILSSPHGGPFLAHGCTNHASARNSHARRCSILTCIFSAGGKKVLGSQHEMPDEGTRRARGVANGRVERYWWASCPGDWTIGRSRDGRLAGQRRGSNKLRTAVDDVRGYGRKKEKIGLLRTAAGCGV